MMDIYDDLDNCLEVLDSEQLLSENKELKLKLEENSLTLNKLKQDFDRLSSEHQLLLKNFSTLLKTAKAEIERKTQTIMQINIEKDELFLRLASSRFNGKKPMSQKNNNNERLLPHDPSPTVSPENYVPDAADVSKMEIDGNRHIKHFTRQQKNKIDQSNHKEIQNTSKNVATNEVKESCRDKENQIKRSDTPVEKAGMMVDSRSQNPPKYTYTAYSSDEEIGEIHEENIDLRNKLKNTRSQESTHPFSHTKDYTRETRSNKYSRFNDYEINERYNTDNLYRHKDKFKERKDFKSFAERQHRSRAPERESQSEKLYQRGRSRHRVDSPTDRYNRDKSRGRQYKQDRYVNEMECRVNERNERVKHKATDGDSGEPEKKRRRHSMYDGPEEGRSRRQSEHFETIDSLEKPRSSVVRPEEDKGSIFCESLSCQSPDDAFAERNVTAQPLKLISHTATTKLDDPRQNSRRYIQIKDKDNKLNLVSARSTKVQLMKVPPWLVIDSKPVDEDKVREIYADIDKQIINMSIEADKSERKDKKEKSTESQEKTTERKNIPIKSTEKRVKPTETQESTETKRKSEEKIVIDKKLLSLPNNITTSILKEDEVKQAIKSLSETEAPIKKYVIPKKVSTNKNETTNRTTTTEANPVPIKKYIVPTKISNIDHERNYAKDTVTTSFGDKKDTLVSNKFEKQISNERTNVPDKDVCKNKNEKVQNAEHIEKNEKTKEKYKSSNPKDKPDITAEIKEKGDEIDGNTVHNKNEPETLKPEPCNPLQIIFNHLKLAQANNQTQEPTTLNKDEINAEPVDDKVLSHAEAKSSTKDTKTVQKSIVEGDLELSDETSDFTQFNDQYAQKADTPKKKKTKKASPCKAVKDFPNKDVKDPSETKTDSETNLNKKTQEIKAKFSDLFGETSCSLITPEDLNLPRPVLENYPCMPSMDSTNEPWSLQNSPWKPEVDNPEQKVDKVAEEAEEKDKTKAIKQKTAETNVKKSDKSTVIDETAIPKTFDNNKQINIDKLHCEKDLETDKQLLTPVAIKPKSTLVNGIENDFQSNYKTPIKALATSTPLRPDDKVTNKKITANTLSMIPETKLSVIPETTLSGIPETTLSVIPETALSGIPGTSLSGIPESSKVSENTTDLLKDLSLSESSKSHTTAEVDAPDVRIVIKRKKRVYKK